MRLPMVADQRKDADWEPYIICDRSLVNSQMDIGSARKLFAASQWTCVGQAPVMASRSYGDGDKMSLLGHSRPYPCDVRFTPVSDRTADVPDRQLRAIYGHSSLAANWNRYSMISSALAINVEGMLLRPSAFAVFRLIASMSFVGCWIGMSAGATPSSAWPTSSAQRPK